jgi:hypothetical protein
MASCFSGSGFFAMPAVSGDDHFEGGPGGSLGAGWLGRARLPTYHIAGYSRRYNWTESEPPP